MKNTLRILLVCCTLFIVNITQATHVVSIDASATCVVKTASNVELQLDYMQLRDVAASTVQFDTEIEIGIYDRGSKKLLKIARIQLVGEEPYGTENTGDFFRIGYYQGMVSLPPSQKGYLILYGRCCTRQSQNLPDDVGSAVVIEILPDMKVGESTLKRDNFGFLLLQRNKQKTLNYNWKSTLYDSIHFETNRYGIFGDRNMPVPQLPQTFGNFDNGTFTNGGSPGDPFGNSGTFSILNDSQYSIAITNLGVYFYPITSTAYLNGDSSISTRMIPVFVMDNVPPLLDLTLTDFNNGIAQFEAYSDDWDFNGRVDLERSETTSSYSFVSLNSDIGDGFALPLEDGTLQNGVQYAYRLKRSGNGKTVYSDTIFLQYNVGLHDQANEVSLTLYPNPAKHQLTIEGSSIGQYQLLDLQGKLQLQGTKSGEVETLSIDELQPGIYILKIASSAYRIVKSH